VQQCRRRLNVYGQKLITNTGRQEQASGNNALMSASPVKIWVVDDETTEHILEKRAFSKVSVPHQVVFFISAEAVIQALTNGTADELPHLILCDINMPGMDGFAFLKWLRQSPWKLIPCDLFSNSDMERDIDRAYALGANAYHVKSRTNVQLEHCIELIVRFWTEVAHPPRPRAITVPHEIRAA
jgi:CheY-like chemotaxis protein